MNIYNFFIKLQEKSNRYFLLNYEHDYFLIHQIEKVFPIIQDRSLWIHFKMQSRISGKQVPWTRDLRWKPVLTDTSVCCFSRASKSCSLYLRFRLDSRKPHALLVLRCFFPGLASFPPVPALFISTIVILFCLGDPVHRDRYRIGPEFR